jgi:hypothetical protein
MGTARYSQPNHIALRWNAERSALRKISELDSKRRVGATVINPKGGNRSTREEGRRSVIAQSSATKNKRRIGTIGGRGTRERTMEATQIKYPASRDEVIRSSFIEI